MIVVRETEETDKMTTLADAAKAYKDTKEAHKQASKDAQAAVLAALKAGHSVPEVTKAGPFTYAYVRKIAEDNNIPRDERKARYRKSETDERKPFAQTGTANPAPPTNGNPLFMSASDRHAELIEKARRLPPGRYVELVSWLEQHHQVWLRANRKRADSDWDLVQKAIRAGLLSGSQLA